jgi:hypothetical protein
MPGMKVTLDAAMRARDVSRPHAEHEALADTGEPRRGQAREQGQGALPGVSAGAASAPGATARGAVPGGTSKGRSPRRRRRRR